MFCNIKFTRKILVLFFGFVVQILFAQNNNGFLRRQNTKFINNDGVVLLKGVNLGNWLHIEPYMINAPTAIAGSYQNLFSAITQIQPNLFHSVDWSYPNFCLD